MNEEELVPFDIEEFFDQLIEKLEKAKSKNLQPVVRESPSWVIAVPDDIVGGRVTDLFTIMVKDQDDELQLHYGNTASGKFYLVTLKGVNKEGFIRAVTEIIGHLYCDQADVPH